MQAQVLRTFPDSHLQVRPILRRNQRRRQQTLCAHKTQTSAEKYNQEMQRKMGWSDLDPYQYHPERGLYYHEIWPGLFCGSQPRSRNDVDQLADFLQPSGTILNLQQDRDMMSWQVHLPDLEHQAHCRSMRYLRRPAQDFDPHSLRMILPAAVKAVHEEMSDGRKVYVHCTAGLGRAPAVCIAYLYWFHDFQLEEAYSRLTNIRPCGPKKEAIRGATFDLLDSRPFGEFQNLPAFSFSEMSVTDREKLQRALNCM